MPETLYPVADDFEAQIRIFTEAQGGRKTAPFNGIRWDFSYEGADIEKEGIYMIWPDFYDDNHDSIPKDQQLPVDQNLSARMTIVVDDMRVQVHQRRIEVGTRFYCHEGAKRVAEGYVTRITGLHISRQSKQETEQGGDGDAEEAVRLNLGLPTGAAIPITFSKEMKTRVACFWIIATLQAIAGELVSPNGQYKIEYVDALPHESNVRLKNVRSGKVLSDEFSNGYNNSSYLETAWSPDSRYLAVVERGTRTTATLTVFTFSGDTVEKTRLPDYTLNLLGRRELLSGGRYHWVSKLRWEATSLTFYCTGQWVDGSGDPELEPSNWYHFDVSITFGALGSEPDPYLAKVAEHNKTNKENKAEMATPRNPSD